MGDTGGILQAVVLWLQEKAAEKPFITWAIGFIGGMLVGFLLWAIGVK